MTKPWILLALLAHGCATSSIAKQPVYTTMYKNGSTLTLDCTGFGPSEDLARKSALDSCRQTAGDAASYQMEAHSLVVETEHSGSYHSEVFRNYSVTGLNCLKMKATTEMMDGSYTTHVRCDFDLSQARTVPILKNKPIYYLHGENRRILLSTIPPCQDILVTGEAARSIACDHNPVTILVKPEDQELIVRAKDRIPKHLPLSEVPATMEVYLERM